MLFPLFQIKFFQQIKMSYFLGDPSVCHMLGTNLQRIKTYQTIILSLLI